MILIILVRIHHPSPVEISSDQNSTELCVADENKIISIFSDLNFIKNVSYETHTTPVIQLVVVHNHDDSSEAFDSIGNTIIALEDKLPDYHIEPWILHESEVQDTFMSGAKKLQIVYCNRQLNDD